MCEFFCRDIDSDIRARSFSLSGVVSLLRSFGRQVARSTGDQFQADLLPHRLDASNGRSAQVRL